MKYTIKFSSIAAIQIVEPENGTPIECICINEKETVAYPNGNCAGNGIATWESLPLTVKAHVNRLFGTVFSLPISQRQSFIESSMPTILEVQS